MNRLETLCVLSATFGSLAGVEPIRLTTSLAPKPYYVGQAIEVKVQIDPDPGPDAVQTPRLSGADLLSIPVEIGRTGEYRFLVVPQRGGMLELPPFRARSGDRSGASKSSRIAVSHVPTEGRGSDFLGGVGPFQVRSEAESSSVRPGQAFEFRVIVSGSGAVGSVRTPDLSGWESPTLRIDRLDHLLRLGEQPTRTFRYRIRASKGGAILLPQVAVASFDPATQHYSTKRTSSLSIRVEEPPSFDPGRLDYRPPSFDLKTSRRKWAAGLVTTVVLTSVSGWAAWFLARRRRRVRPVDPVGLAMELSRNLVAAPEEIEEARGVAEALTLFLHRVAGRPDGALTPSEARAWYGQFSGNEPIGHRAERLMIDCDRARFGLGGEERREIVRDGRQFLEDLAGSMSGGITGGNGKGPGEAVETSRGSRVEVENCPPPST